jgi:hypothetical protein
VEKTFYGERKEKTKAEVTKEALVLFGDPASLVCVSPRISLSTSPVKIFDLELKLSDISIGTDTLGSPVYTHSPLEICFLMFLGSKA